MKLVHVSQELQFNLGNGRISYIFRVSPEGLLEHIHFGADVAPSDSLPAGPRRDFKCTTLEFQGIPNYNLDDTPQEYPLFGSSDTRQPALHVLNAHGNTTNILLYEKHQVISDKPSLDGLPSARGGGSETLVVTLRDTVSELIVNLLYTVYQDHDVIARSVSIENTGSRPVSLQQVMSSSLDLPTGDYELLHLKGSWSRELHEERMRIPHGRFVIESARGTSSNTHNPFMAVMSQGTNEASGEVYATSLVYSGNFAINVEKGEFEGVRISSGINPFNFQWRLNPGEIFTCPESLNVFSQRGLNGMSQVWHKFVKEKIAPAQFKDQSRPTYLNSWEAAYFDVNESVVIDLANKAKSLGLEMLVLDDGWFAARNDETSSLGDWFSDPDKFPNGVQDVARQVNELGLKFGLWFEPEMVNERSQLFSDHSDWIIHVPNRKLSTGRYQYTLDLSRADVVDYLYERLDSFLSCGHINYVKWDMNRTMTEVGSAGLSDQQQQETAHRYMLGLYSLVERLTLKYPDVLFENCASGGNRFDLGMLRYMAQGWVSDMSEPIGRLPIINGASYLFPPSVLASYIGPVPSHQNGRLSSLKTRTEVGFFCAARGVSLNVPDIDSDIDELKAAISLYKETADDLSNGRFYRLRYSANEVCWQLSSADDRRIYVGYFHILSCPNAPYRRARLQGLDSQSHYRLVSKDQVYGGAALMNLGVDLPYVCEMRHLENADYSNHMDKGDFSSRLLIFEQV